MCRGHVERSLAALLVGRTGRGECAELDGLLSELPVVPAPEDLRQRTLDDIALVAHRRPLGGFWRRGAKVGAAAAAVVALLITGGVLATLPEPATPDAAFGVPDPTTTTTTAIPKSKAAASRCSSSWQRCGWACTAGHRSRRAPVEPDRRGVGAIRGDREFVTVQRQRGQPASGMSACTSRSSQCRGHVTVTVSAA